MPRAKTDASSVEPEKSVESDGKVDIDEDNDPEEAMDKEIEYEEVEEEEEVEEIEEKVEEEEEEEEEEVEEKVEEDANIAIGTNVKNSESSEEEKKKHAELLALPPHGSEVYIGGIPHDATQEDLKVFCEAVGEVTEVSLIALYEVPCLCFYKNNFFILYCSFTTGPDYEGKRFR
jgi:heterogeneous nuclear ribonucleoprotein R